jgi:hypothetical protein
VAVSHEGDSSVKERRKKVVTTCDQRRERDRLPVQKVTGSEQVTFPVWPRGNTSEANFDGPKMKMAPYLYLSLSFSSFELVLLAGQKACP